MSGKCSPNKIAPPSSRMRKWAYKSRLPTRKDSQDTSDTTDSHKCGVQQVCISIPPDVYTTNKTVTSSSSEDACNEIRLNENTPSPSSVYNRNAFTPSVSPILFDQLPAVGAERFTCPDSYFLHSSKWYWDYNFITALYEWAEWLVDGESGYVDTTTMKWVTTPRTDIN
jgi:hypothetical protein